MDHPEISQRDPRYDRVIDGVDNISVHPWIYSLCMYIGDQRESTLSSYPCIIVIPQSYAEYMEKIPAENKCWCRTESS